MTTQTRNRELLAECHGVTVVYGDGEAAIRALDRVDLVTARGERLALLGRSGSGKTTLLHVLGGLVGPSSGSVEWRGQRLSTVDASARSAARAHGIAYVFQGANLLPNFTAFENVAFAAHLAREAIHPLALLEIVGLLDRADRLPAELSGGEAQRVAIARALAQKPELLLCDEPTGHLDSRTGGRVLDLIDELQHELGFGLVIATHDADVAARLTRQAELHDGCIVREERA